MHNECMGLYGNLSLNCCKLRKDTVDFLIAKYFARLCFVNIKNVAFVMFVISENQVTPALYLLCPGV